MEKIIDIEDLVQVTPARATDGDTQKTKQQTERHSTTGCLSFRRVPARFAFIAVLQIKNNKQGNHMKLTLNHCTIADVMTACNKDGDGQRKNRKVILHVDEEDFFGMLDQVNPKNIIKYLDMRKIPHREALEINVTDCTVRLTGKASRRQDGIRHGLYNMNQRNRRKLNRALELLGNMRAAELPLSNTKGCPEL